jgi:hypothetical protein
VITWNEARRALALWLESADHRNDRMNAAANVALLSFIRQYPPSQRDAVVDDLCREASAICDTMHNDELDE